MRPQAILVVTLVALTVLAALPIGEACVGTAGYLWPCCDNCGACNRKQPPECSCNDVMVNGCHPECKNCVRNTPNTLPGFGPGPVVTYTCADILTNFCQRNCTAAR